MSNTDFLNWVADRLVAVYGEPNNVDFVLALRRIARELASPTTPNVARVAANNDAVIEAANKLAGFYSEDERECIRIDVTNAFYAGVKFQRELAAPVSTSADAQDWEDGYEEGVAVGRAFAADAQAAVVPEGWRLVPTKPDQAMCQAGQYKAREWPKFPLRIGPIYQAMLDAAPIASALPTAQGGVDG